jgi:TorA maturation chaperone TorD
LLAAVAGAPSLSPAPPGDVAGTVAADLAAAWDALRVASAATPAAAAADEFHTLFVGVGRSEVSLYASHYVGPQSGRPLAEIRAALARLGLARQPGSSEFEDHLGMLLETMRMLVAGDLERGPAPIGEQRAFFERYIAAWACDCCTAIAQSPVAIYYRTVGQFLGFFLALERTSFAMD